MSTGSVVDATARAGQAVKFETDEPLWYNNGRWGAAGYAIPNPGGKTWCLNDDVLGVQQMIARNVFELAHRQEAKFYVAPNKQYWFDVHQMLTVGIKRMADLVVNPNTNNVLNPQHINPAPQVWKVYPVPYFGDRIRQLDIRRLIGRMLSLQGEIMQHSDAEREGYFTTQFAAMVTSYFQESLAWIATKYFEYTREEAYAPGFKIADDRFANYDPFKVLTPVESTDERQPIQWWPTENDLSDIRGLPINEALVLCQRWPATDLLDHADGAVLVNPRAADSGSTGSSATPTAVQMPGAAP